MKWIRTFRKRAHGCREEINAPETGDYWITDGYYVMKGHYHADTNGEHWGIYQPDKFGIIKHCYPASSDMNFDVKAYAKMEHPKVPVKFRDL